MHKTSPSVFDPRSGKRRQPLFDYQSASEVDGVLAGAGRAATTWRLSTATERIQFCRKAAELLRKDADTLARLAVAEMGKLLPEARAEIEKCAGLCDHYAELVAIGLAAEGRSLEGARALISYQPLGVILGIMPWNFPFWQVARFAIPAICAGNTAILKHAGNVQGCAQAFVALLNEAASSELISNLHLDNESTEAVIADPRIAGVSLTGSTRAGRSVGAAAGRALKPSVLELGGSDPYLILADADLPLAVAIVSEGRLLNAGQSCIGPKRLIVDRAVYDEFCDALRQNLEAVVFAGPDANSDSSGQLAPLARADLRDTLDEQVLRSVGAGAELLLGGIVPERDGWYYPATLLVDVPPSSPAFSEELFGPVWAVAPVSSTAEAVELANASSFGLGGAVISRDVAKAADIAQFGLRCGAAVVNDFVRSDPRLPFGGVGESGYGRELSVAGLRAFTNLKSTVIRSRS